MRLQSIQTKIALIGGIGLAVTATVLASYSITSANSTKDIVLAETTSLITERTHKELSITTEKYAQIIENRIEQGINSARTIAETISSKNTGQQTLFNRNTFNLTLQSVLKSNPDLNGVYSAWEPDKFDHQDEQFIGAENGSETNTGRFIPYWTRSASGQITVAPLVDFDSLEKHPNGIGRGAWYQIPKLQGKETVTAPLPYQVQGQSLWLATLSVPIKFNGQFAGVIGADYNLQFVQSLSQQISQQLYEGQSQVTILTDQSLVLANSQDASTIGKQEQNLFGQAQDRIKKLAHDHQLGSFESKNAKKEQAFFAVAPIALGRGDSFWLVVVQVPKATVLADAYKLEHRISDNNDNSIRIQILLSFVVALIAIAVLAIFAKKIAAPILRAVGMAKSIAGGEFGQRLDYHSHDEVGVLAEALDNMTASLEKHVAIAEQISQGNLNVTVTKASEHDQLGNALTQMLDDLNKVIFEIGSNSDHIASSAEGVSDLSHNLAAGAAQSASAVTEISASIAEIATQIQQSSVNAHQVNELSQKTLNAAHDGNKMMHALSNAMHDINQSGQDINNIISSIEEIAEQTNLLALNAAIEAARAGEYGRGFAVVADEVRQLAVRSATAVQQTAKLIENSATNTQKGIQLTESTSKSLDEILGHIDHVAGLVAEISTASSEQSSAAEQVNIGIQQIDEVVHQNGQISEECANSSKEMEQQSRTLISLVSRFQLRNK